ncbi:MAG: dihydrolipoamide acetyltransferase [Myxococcota bacterium]
MSVVRFALSCALVGWLCLGGPAVLAQPADPDARAEPSPPAEPPAEEALEASDESDATAAVDRNVEETGAARRHAASEFHRELRSVEEEVGQLKERVFRSKATLKLLKELVVDAAASGSRVVLWHVNDLGGGYGLESVQYFIDGKNVFTRIDPDGSLDEIQELKFHEQPLAAGPHTLQVNLVLRGRGFRIFSYLESFQFKVQSSYQFTIEEGKVSLIRVVVDSRGGFRNFEERPTVRYDERKHIFRETDGEAPEERSGGRKKKKADKVRPRDARDDNAPAD